MSVPIAPSSNAPGPHLSRRAAGPASVQNSPSFYNPVPLGSVLGGAVAGTPYSEAITAQGGTSPFSFSISSGALPTGVSLASGGTISGTPSATGTFTFTITVTDSHGFTGSQSFSITVATAATGGGGSANYGFIG